MPAGGHAIDLALAQQAEIAGPLKGAELVPFVGGVQLIQETITRVAGIGRDIRRQAQRSVIKEVGHKPHRLHMGGGKLVEMHRLLVNIAQMEKLDAKRQLFLRPQRPVVPKRDLAILVISQVLQKRGKISPRRAKRFVRAQLGLFGHVIERHMHRLQPRKSKGWQRTGKYRDQEENSLHPDNQTISKHRQHCKPRRRTRLR